MALSGIPLLCPLSLFKNALYALQNSGKLLLSYWERQRQRQKPRQRISGAYVLMFYCFCIVDLILAAAAV